MTAYIFGNLPNIEEGNEFENRQELRKAGIHLALQSGIDGNSKVGSPSIVLSGGYEDDEDFGDIIIYTGHGGNDIKTKKQISDQSWDSPGNKALLISELHGLPVRVTRGYKHRSSLSPIKGYKYGGLYQVTEHFEKTGKNGFLICKYRLEKISNLNTLAREEQEEYHKDPSRKAVNILRIVRDTKLSIDIKKLYDYSCQICNITIAVHNVKYAEGAHIKPLGTPHNGLDLLNNLLCLCPNHHVMLDKGMIAINSDLTLLGIEGNIKLHKDHILDDTNCQYHKEHIFINK